MIFLINLGIWYFGEVEIFDGASTSVYYEYDIATKFLDNIVIYCLLPIFWISEKLIK